VVDVLAVLAGLGLGLSIGLGVTSESAGALRAAGGVATALGRMSGLLCAYVMIIVVLLSARIAPLERAVGQDRLIAWHRRLGPWGLYLLLAHVALITIGYAQAAHRGLVYEFGQLIWTYPRILAAVVGFALLITAGVTSYHRARRRLAHETWWAIHLYTYLGLLLGFFHQVDTGAPFVGHPFARFWWTALWLGTLGTVLGFRVALPLWRSFRHQLRVVEVRPEAAGTWSILLEGRDLHQLPIAGGQFLQWRFLRPGLWWQAHPYSISAVPSNRYLRVTVKELGDHSSGLAEIPPGTRVAFEGPYGVFTADARHRNKVLLVGAGVGSTPIRALLDDLPAETDVVVILRGSTTANLVHRDEFRQILQKRHRGPGRLHELVGSRHDLRLDATTLRTLVPDVSRRDVYVCGPESFTDVVVAAAVGAGVPEAHVHRESFTF
jgi:predicted ferric reductase